MLSRCPNIVELVLVVDHLYRNIVSEIQLNRVYETRDIAVGTKLKFLMLDSQSASGLRALAEMERVLAEVSDSLDGRLRALAEMERALADQSDGEKSKSF